MPMPSLARRSMAEAIGTFALVFAGTGAIISNELSGGSVTHVGVALTFGLVVLAMIYAVGPISGAHFNPAVSFGFWLSGRFQGRDLAAYVLVQCGSAIAASALLRAIFPTHLTLGATHPLGGVARSFLLEVVATFFLMFVILCVATGAKEQGIMAGTAIGATVALDALFAGPISGASMNPARSIAPALVSGNIGGLWIYLTAPLVGAAVAVAAFRFLNPLDHARE